MKYYFFHHPLESRSGIPGRYAFHSQGRLVAPDGTTTVREFSIPADGLGPDRAGPNIDPSVFAAPFPIVHSFCKLDAVGGKYYVNDANGASSRRNLAQVAAEGDTIIYGHLRAPVTLFVDTVLVVASIRSLSTTPNPIDSRKPFRLIVGEPLAAALGAWSAKPQLDGWELLLQSDLWRFNLRDLDAGSGHSQTAHRVHKILVGRVAPEGEEARALAFRETSYVPLVQESPGSRPLPPHLDEEHSEPAFWGLLTKWLERNPRLANGNKPTTELPVEIGESIYDGIRRRSGGSTSFEGFVALPPLRWTRSFSISGEA